MAERRRVDLINPMLDLAEWSQGIERRPLIGPLYSSIANAVHKSDSPAYIRAEFRRAQLLIDEHGNPTTLPIAEADVDSKKLIELRQGKKKEAVVVGVARAALESVLQDNPYGKAALSFTLRGITRAGILPHGLEDLGQEDELFTGALRVGGESFGVGVGVWLPGEKVVVAPKDNIIVAQHLNLDELPGKYPGTPLV